MKAVSFIFVVLFTSLLGTSAWAEGPISAAVLNLEADGVSEELASTLTSVIRNEAQQIENYQVVNKVAINLQDILLVLGCSEDSTVCLKRASAEVNARMLIFGRISKSAESYQITIKIFDAQQGAMVENLSRTIANVDDPVAAFRKEILTLFAGEKAPVEATMLRIGSNVSGAKVFLEDTFVGTAPLEKDGLPVGKYRVAVSHPEYETWETILQIKPGSDIDLWAPLKKKSGINKVTPLVTHQTAEDAALDAKLEQEHVGSVNWGAWSTIGVGGAAILGSLVFAVMMFDVENQLEQEASDQTLTENRYDELTNRGESFELTHQVLLGVGAVATISGVVWLLVDNRDKTAAAVKLGVRGNSVEASLHW